MAGQRRGFRARFSSARQSIFLITEIIFGNLLAIVSSKAAEIGMSEVAKKNSRHFCPLPKTTSERQITQHVKVTRIDVLKTFSLWKSRF